ncbi:IclR family transcriptional regulator [Xanthobacter sp. TB0136]|uniref:IclR family transcriptional regulator n=1 Tax=Xanthobacter sp. TB0136 TaxID=3459177 RepID=UPI0040395EA2
MSKDGAAIRENGGIQVIARAAAILRALKNVRSGLSLAQIAARVGLPRSTVQRIVNALLEENLVISAGPEGGYRLGPEIHALSRSGKIDIVEVVRPHIVAISQSTGETVDFSVLRGSEVLFLDQVTGTHRLRAVSAVGDIFPLTNTANGKCCLALLDPERARALILKELRSSKRLDAVLAEIAEVRRTGTGFNHEEHTVGISAVGIGFRDAAGGLYSISVPVPTSRFMMVKDDAIRELHFHKKMIVQKIGSEHRNI